PSSERGTLDLFRPARHMLGIMNHERYNDSYIRGILNTVKTIAMVGASAKDNRPSYFAFKYLSERGYIMIPINPGLAGKELLGRRIYANLSEVPEPIDMVEIFRASNYALPIVREALTVKTIAMVGASAKDNRPSYFAFKYLSERGYIMIPINPGLAGKELLGRRIYANLSEVPEPIDMVEIFRASNYALPIVREALTLK